MASFWSVINPRLSIKSVMLQLVSCSLVCGAEFGRHVLDPESPSVLTFWFVALSTAPANWYRGAPRPFMTFTAASD